MRNHNSRTSRCPFPKHLLTGYSAHNCLLPKHWYPKMIAGFCCHHHFMLCKEVDKCSPVILSTSCSCFYSIRINKLQPGHPHSLLGSDHEISIQLSSVHHFDYLQEVSHGSCRMPAIRCSKKELVKELSSNLQKKIYDSHQCFGMVKLHSAIRKTESRECFPATNLNFMLTEII